MTTIFCAGVGGNNQSCGRQEQCIKYRPWWTGAHRVSMNLCGSIERGRLVAFVAKDAVSELAKVQQELFA